MKGAGTDAQVFLQVYGETGKSDEMKLESKSDSFEQGQCDKFIVCLCVFLSLCLIKMYSGPKTYLIPKCQFIYVITLDKNISVDKFDVLFLTRVRNLKMLNLIKISFCILHFCCRSRLRCPISERYAS